MNIASIPEWMLMEYPTDRGAEALDTFVQRMRRWRSDYEQTVRRLTSDVVWQAETSSAVVRVVHCQQPAFESLLSMNTKASEALREFGDAWRTHGAALQSAVKTMQASEKDLADAQQLSMLTPEEEGLTQALTKARTTHQQNEAKVAELCGKLARADQQAKSLVAHFAKAIGDLDKETSINQWTGQITVPNGLAALNVAAGRPLNDEELLQAAAAEGGLSAPGMEGLRKRAGELAVTLMPELDDDYGQFDALLVKVMNENGEYPAFAGAFVGGVGALRLRQYLLAAGAKNNPAAMRGLAQTLNGAATAKVLTTDDIDTLLFGPSAVLAVNNPNKLTGKLFGHLSKGSPFAYDALGYFYQRANDPVKGNTIDAGASEMLAPVLTKISHKQAFEFLAGSNELDQKRLDFLLTENLYSDAIVTNKAQLVANAAVLHLSDTGRKGELSATIADGVYGYFGSAGPPQIPEAARKPLLELTSNRMLDVYAALRHPMASDSEKADFVSADKLPIEGENRARAHVQGKQIKEFIKKLCVDDPARNVIEVSSVKYLDDLYAERLKLGDVKENYREKDFLTEINKVVVESMEADVKEHYYDHKTLLGLSQLVPVGGVATSYGSELVSYVYDKSYDEKLAEVQAHGQSQELRIDTEHDRIQAKAMLNSGMYDNHPIFQKKYGEYLNDAKRLPPGYGSTEEELKALDLMTRFLINDAKQTLLAERKPEESNG